MITNRFSLSRLMISLSVGSLITIAMVYSLPHIMLANATSDRPSTTEPFPDPASDMSPTTSEQTAIVAGGCFWGMEAVFERLNGVSDVVSGFSGGSAATAHYEAVSSGATDHAEAVKITYDPSQISYGQLLKVYFSVAHDPTQLNRQGPDHGSQYRSAIFFTNDDQQQIAQAYIDQLNTMQVFAQPIATQLVPFQKFYAAEDYHQNFIDRNPFHPYVVMHDLPKLERLKERFPDLYQN